MPRGLYIGRFQPFHRGHLETVRGIRAESPHEELIIGVGATQESYTWTNPLTGGERIEIILRALKESGVTGCLVLPIPDIDRHNEWVAYVEGLVPPFERIYTNNPLTRLLFERRGYRVYERPWVDREHLEGRRIRERLARGEDVGALVAPSTAAYLAEIGAPARLRLLAPADPGPA